MWYRLHTFIVALGCVLMALNLTGCHGSTLAQAQGRRASHVMVEKVTGGLREPVALAFLSDTTILVAERAAGRIRWIEHGVLRNEPFASVPVPTVAGHREYGLLGLAADPDYPKKPFVYAFHTVGAGSRVTGQRIVRFTVRNGKGEDETTLVDKLPVGATCCDNGGRLLFGTDGKLYVTIGDTQRAPQAQNYEALAGKVLRFNRDGTIPADNPCELTKTATASNPRNDTQQVEGNKTPVYALGFHNPFGMALDARTGEIYLTDSGSGHHDELDRLVAADNYGWPLVTGAAEDPHFRTPLWDSGAADVAPSGLASFSGSSLAGYRDNLFFASAKDGKLRRAVLRGPDHIAEITTVPAADGLAWLDVAMGRDDHLYFTSMDAVYRLRGEG